MDQGRARMERAVFGPEHYSARASELEAAGERIADTNIRASYLELARSFREMASLAGLMPKPADDEVDRAAGRAPDSSAL